MTALRLYIRRFPVTISLLFVLAVTAVLTNSHISSLEPVWLSQLGFAARDFWELRWGRLFTSALVTLGGAVFWQAMGMVMLAVGAVEYLTGSKSALATFWGVHLATLLAEGAVVGPALHWLVFNGDSLLLLARDVGPSAGYFGSLGMAVAALPVQRRWRGLLAAAVFAALVLALFQPPDGEDTTLKLLANIAHVLAFPLGLAAWRLRRMVKRQASETAVPVAIGKNGKGRRTMDRKS
ncbi:MAG: hypothetical protein H6667_06305 [Ardenticatenaceae bacterium]|nr:hypothetical protein [Ardenticatenaceae bacterium]MCB9442793.1 hypothetical protein [Ardenticatenaceae bacterium]